MKFLLIGTIFALVLLMMDYFRNRLHRQGERSRYHSMCRCVYLVFGHIIDDFVEDGDRDFERPDSVRAIAVRLLKSMDVMYVLMYNGFDLERLKSQSQEMLDIAQELSDTLNKLDDFEDHEHYETINLNLNLALQLRPE